ncbi:MAG: hypothetical protein ABIQ64_02960 [Candidatus Saccharimonadales bacterium]
MKKSQKTNTSEESNGFYFLKIMLYIVLGSLWIRFASPLELGPFTVSAFPIGLILGLLIASHDKLQIDRKIEYVVLIIFAIFSFFLPTGIVI